MTDYNRDSLDLQDEDRLPWLEAVDDMEEDDGVSLARLILLIVAGLLFLGVIIGGIYWLQSIRSGGGEGTLIAAPEGRSEEHTSELQSLMRISYAVFCLKKKKRNNTTTHYY